MSLTTQCTEMSLDGTTLKAKVGEAEITLDLNQVLGNNDGWFLWGSQGALQDAQEVSLSLEQDNAIAVLRAKLKKADQNYNTDLAVVNLGERIQVKDGQFSFA